MGCMMNLRASCIGWARALTSGQGIIFGASLCCVCAGLIAKLLSRRGGTRLGPLSLGIYCCT